MIKIAYEPHPVSPERKAELRAQGFTIIDSRFAPPSASQPVEPIAEPVEIETNQKPKRRRKSVESDE